MAIVSLIAAVAKNRVIGREKKLPWDLPDDLRHFHQVTRGKSFLMGRKSYETEDRLLSNHQNFILTTKHQVDLCANCQLVHSLEAFLSATQNEKEVFVLGGGVVYALALEKKIIDRMYITEINANPEGDTFFPELNWEDWKVVSATYHPKDAEHNFDFTIKVYEREGG